MSATRYYNLETLTIDEQSRLIEDLARLQGVKSGVCIPAGYHNRYDLIRNRNKIFELSHDLHHIGFVQLIRFNQHDLRQQKLLGLLLQPEHDGKFFPADTCIVADYSPSEARQYYAMVLSHAIMVGRNIYGEMTAQVVDENEICAGTQAKVYDQLGTLRYRGEPRKREIVFERAKRERVVRVSRIQDLPVDRARVERVRALSYVYPHLATRGTVFFSTTGRTVKPGLNYVYVAQSMHAIEEMDLYDLIQKEYSFSIDKRFNLLIAVTHALYREAHIHGVAHRDFKPENIRIKKTVLSYTAHLLDYNDAIKSGEIDTNQVGTADYMSEEAVGCLADKPADIFALYGFACILFRDKEQHKIWGISNPNFQEAFDTIIARRQKSKWNIQPSLFHDLDIFDDLSDKTKHALTELFALMCKQLPQERIKLLPFLNQLESIFFLHRLESIPRNQQEHVIKANLIARQVRLELDDRAATMCLYLENINKLQHYLLSKIRELPDKDVAFTEFCKVTGILCLHNYHTIEGAVFHLTCVFDDVRASFGNINDFVVKLRNLHEGVRNDGLTGEQLDSLTALDKQILDLKLFKAKMEKLPLDVNEFPCLLKHIGEKLEKVMARLKDFVCLNEVSKPLALRMK